MEHFVISVKEARQLIADTVPVGPSENRSLLSACGLFLAEEIRALHPMPPFNNSAMDGFGLQHTDVSLASEASPVTLRLIGEVAAGSARQTPLKPGQAVRIFTGAPIPNGVDSVIRQEDVEISEDHILIRRPVRNGENIRRQGEEAKAGDLILSQGQCLSPAAIGVLASQGIETVSVHRQPRVGIIITGSEILSRNATHSHGMIHDSNSPALHTALNHLGISTTFYQTCGDHPQQTVDSISTGLNQCDLLLITGGVSVGKHDYVKQAVQQAGLEQVFWRVRQKPGKPLFFAASPTRDKLIFGLPGNPASVLTSFYEYVKPALRTMMGASEPGPVTALGKLSGSYRKAAGLAHFLKAHTDTSGNVHILEGQGSHMMASYARANCLVTMDEDETELKEGDVVKIHMLPV